MTSNAVPFLNATIHLPVFELDAVYHVGGLEGPHKRREENYEADCLSVSLHPEEWARIARIGNTTHKLSKKGGLFLDVLSISKRARSDIEAWGAMQGYLVTKRIYKVVVERDVEEDSPGYSFFESRDEALAEAMDGEKPRAVPSVAATPKLLALRGVRRPHLGADAFDLVAMTWAAASGLDGLWWTELYDPEGLSCPRGGIVPERLQEWVATACDGEYGDEDDDDLDRFPRSAIRPFLLSPRNRSDSYTSK